MCRCLHSNPRVKGVCEEPTAVELIDGVVAATRIFAVVQVRGERRVHRRDTLVGGHGCQVPVVIHHGAEELLGRVHAGTRTSKKLIITGEAFSHPKPLSEVALVEIQLLEWSWPQPAYVPRME